MNKKLLIAFAFMPYFGHAHGDTTWAEHIAPILYNNCTSCHHPGGLAPFSLMEYTDAYNYKQSIYVSTQSKKMPPWPPDANYSKFAHERVLTAQQISAIKDWVADGAPQGDILKAPKQPTYTGTGFLPNADLTLTIPSYSVKSTNDEYRNFAIPSGLLAANYISQMEVLPGNSGIVHHVLVFQDSTNTSLQQDAADADPGYYNFGGASSLKLIGAWVPGSLPLILPNGTGVRLPKGSTIVLQIHYPKGSQGDKDSTMVRFKLTTQQMRDVTINSDLYHIAPSLQNGPLFIPANTVKTFKERQYVPVDMTIMAVAPHMHLLGKNIKVYAVMPTKDTLPLINIPDWDFHWQGMYYFKKAIKLPKGTTVWAEATYDNTINNPRNPNSPPANVGLGEATTDEMMLVYITRMFYRTGDENILLDSSGITSISNTSLQKLAGVLVYPNPVTDRLTLELSQPGNYQLDMFDVAGNRVWTEQVVGERKSEVQVAKLAAGVYFYRVQGRDGTAYGQFVKE